MVTTESGIAIVMSDLQELNAYAPMVTTESGITTLVISDSLRKAFAPMAVKESGMVKIILVKCEQTYDTTGHILQRDNGQGKRRRGPNNSGR